MDMETRATGLAKINFTFLKQVSELEKANEELDGKVNGLENQVVELGVVKKDREKRIKTLEAELVDLRLSKDKFDVENKGLMIEI